MDEDIEKEELKGIQNHTTRLIIIDSIGLNLNIVGLDLAGMIISLEKSLIASLKGCRKPTTPTLLGPLRSWEYPNTLRSKRVINATFTNTGIIVRIYDKIEVILLVLEIIKGKSSHT